MTYARAIFFDAVGTLFRVRGGVGQLYWEIARPYGVKATPEMIESVFAEVFAGAPPLAFSRVRSNLLRRSEKEWWHAVVKEVFQRVGMLRNFEGYFDKVYRAFSGIRGWELYPEASSVLRDLKKTGFTLGIISNFDSRILTVCTDLRIFQYFDSIHISSRTGSAKPDLPIFRKALEQHGLRPHEAVHIGDSLEEDVKGALGAGMVPIFLDRHKAKNRPEGVLSIKSLSEISSAIAFL